MEELSARNRLNGEIRSVNLGTIMAEVVLDVAGQELVSMITRVAERLD
jgi:molybdopterin-binding protein